MDNLDRIYHIIVEVDGVYPLMETDLVPHYMGTDIPIDFYLYGKLESHNTFYMAITIEEPSDHDDGTYYVPVVPPEQDDIEVAILYASDILGEIPIQEHPNTRYITTAHGHRLYSNLVEVEENSHRESFYDRYKVKLYFAVPK